MNLMHLVFIDDAKQSPTRPGFKGKAVGAAALHVPADRARVAERAIRATCKKYRFTDEEEFKWSPNRDSWMYSGLVGPERQQFFFAIAERLVEARAFASIVIEDAGRNPATGALTTEQDVLVLLLERVANRLRELGEIAIVIADRPGGDRREEDRFVADCLQYLQAGTDYVEHNEVSFVFTTDSKFVRLLQATDLLASSLTAYVAGEGTHSPPIVERLLALFPLASDRRGGYSIKLHPDYNFANLHHWLFGDTHLVRGNVGVPMPLKGWDYYEGPDNP
jgi:hypothetical protein